MRSSKERCMIFLTFFMSACGLAFIGTAFGTDYWIESTPVRNASAVGINEPLNDGDKFKGELNFGIFKGSKVLNAGFGGVGRRKEIKVFSDYIQTGLFSYGLWVTTIVAASIAVMWGVVAAVFAVINTATKPIETITGPTGLYFWNSLAMLFTIFSVSVWVAMYYTQFSDNVLVQEDIDNLWSSRGKSRFAWSFWLLVGAVLCFALNILIVVLSGIRLQPFSKHRAASMSDKNIEVTIMY